MDIFGAQIILFWVKQVFIRLVLGAKQVMQKIVEGQSQLSRYGSIS
jgi:hypothetical protein